MHGWLIDPQEKTTAELIGGRSYNELVETVIHGNEAMGELEALANVVRHKEKELENLNRTMVGSASVAGVEGEETKVEEVDLLGLSELPERRIKETLAVKAEGSTRGKQKIRLGEELEGLRSKIRDKSKLASEGSVINDFLTSTSHQLTYHGLHELHRHVPEECLCVFFRNNHFATMTKRLGILYLLVTDLGYANVPEVIWEKLDSINGNTELFDEYFVRPAPRKSIGAAEGPAVSPEALLAQRGRIENDRQLALQIQGGDNQAGRAKTQTEMDDEEGRLIAAATEASLKEWSGQDRDGSDGDRVGQRQPSISTSPGNKAHVGVPLDPDLALALSIQAEMDRASEDLARQLQREEDERVGAVRRRELGASATMAPDRMAQQPSNSNCIIS